MFRFAWFLLLSVELGMLAGCSDLGSDPSTGGTGGDGGEWFDDPPAITTGLYLGCTNNLSSDLFVVSWDLTVDPGPIVQGQAFGATFSGVAVLDELLLDGVLGRVPGGYRRSIVLGVRATVHARSGVAPDAMDVVLTNEPIPRSCAYDRGGHTGPDAPGPFPACSEADDNPDGSNEGCTGLGGGPDPANVCAQFVTIPTSNDCDPGGLCENKGKTGPGSQCDLNRFCVSGPLPLQLEAAYEGYLADESGTVLFGWDDESTGAELDPSGGPDGGKWILPPSVFDEPGPNSLRGLLPGNIPAALDCTMGDGVTTVLRRTPDSQLISFPIQTP
ncbi:MAG: hypothetical protein WCF10_12255 [Polyangiales bacterium]